MLEIQNVTVRYDNNFEAVKKANFTVGQGEFFTLLGPSGCGKTTMLRAIAGFETVSAGKILIDGHDIANLTPEEREIGFVFQNYALFPSMSVYDNIAFGLKVRKLRKPEIKNKVENIAELIGITEHLQKKISQISGGQQQRVAIARALVTEPKLLLMDEPLSNLDAKLRVSMRSEIKRIQQQLGIEAVYVTHDQEEAMAISDQIAVFHQGNIEQIDSPQAIYHNPQTIFTAQFVGDINVLDQNIVSIINQQTRVGLQQPGFIRMEKLHLCTKPNAVPTGAIRLIGKVKSSEFLGVITKTTVRIADGFTLAVTAFDAQSTKEQQDVIIYFNPDDVIHL